MLKNVTELSSCKLHCYRFQIKYSLTVRLKQQHVFATAVMQSGALPPAGPVTIPLPIPSFLSFTLHYRP
jgi:hypothetical protein